jgi:hypothetical protein
VRYLTRLKDGDQAKIRLGFEQSYRDYKPLVGYKWPDPLFHDGDIVIIQQMMTDNAYVSLPGDCVCEAVPVYMLIPLDAPAH